jgi:hypothetical protein
MVEKGVHFKRRKHMNIKNPEDVKSCNLKVRITAAEREALQTYCETYGMKMSEFIRAAVLKELSKRGVTIDGE